MIKRGKVLVIEDERIWQNTLKDFLEEANFYVEVANNLEEGLAKINSEMFHFVTIDLKLEKKTVDPDEYEGWKILKDIISKRADLNTGTMVITAYHEDYLELKGIKKIDALFFMPKKDFNKEKFLDIIIKDVEKINLRFHDDKRGG